MQDFCQDEPSLFEQSVGSPENVIEVVPASGADLLLSFEERLQHLAFLLGAPVLTDPDDDSGSPTAYRDKDRLPVLPHPTKDVGRRLPESADRDDVGNLAHGAVPVRLYENACSTSRSLRRTMIALRDPGV
jgi:hypothetical protein